jgi:4-amino-4-deoxy-L-arabinose transferase-like glycosyltransferase
MGSAFRWLLVAAIPVYFIALGANSIWDANEAFYVETPRQMVLTGDYVRPSFNAMERFNKPVLSYWVVAGLYHAFGISVGVERLGIALGAMGMLLATFLIGRAIGGTPTGVLAALLVASAPRIVFFSRRIFIDVYITLFMALTLACFVLAERVPHRRRLWLSLMYVAMALGVLTKGPMAVVLPAAAVGAWLLVERRAADLRRLMLGPGLLIVAAIVAPWWIAVGLSDPHGWQHARDFFIGENVGRFTSSMTGARSPLFYLGVLFADFLLPWAPLLAVTIVFAWRRRRDGSPVDPIRRLLWIWIAVIVGGFSFSASKEDLYILSVVPAAATLIADALQRTGFGATDGPIRSGLAVIAASLVAAGAFVWWFLRDGYYAVAMAGPLAAGLVVFGVVAMALLARRRFEAAVVSIAAACLLVNYLLVWRVLPDLERLKPVPALAAAIRANGTSAAQIAWWNMDLPSLVYYANQAVTPLDGLPHARQYLAQYPEPWVVMGEPEWAALQPAVSGFCVVDRRRLFETRLADIVRGIPPPEILLVSKCRSPTRAAAASRRSNATAAVRAIRSSGTPAPPRRRDRASFEAGATGTAR